jgi:L-iditol 2-dehydrogenase
VKNIPETMLALVLTKAGEHALQEIPVPEPGPDEVLCRVRAVAICGTDPKIIRGDTVGKWPPSFPFIPGHEWSGEVVVVGKDVIGFQPGDRVAGEAHSGCGFCSNCMKGSYNLCENYGKPDTGHRHYGHLSSGAYAQFNVFKPRSITRMPDTVSYHQGALVDTAGVALHCMSLTGITPGGTVAVVGPGPVGLVTMLTARVLGASRIIAVGRGFRLKASQRLGATDLVDFEKEDPVQSVREKTGGKGADEAFECSGVEGTFAQAVDMVKRGGSVGLMGIPPATVLEKLPFAKIVLDEISIHGCRANPNVSARVLDLIASVQLKVDPMITHSLPLSEFERAYDLFVNRKDGAIKVIVEPNSPEK